MQTNTNIQNPNPSPPVVVQVSEPPKVPKWGKETFETFEGRIGDWLKRSQESKGTQYLKFVDSLKDNDKKKGVSEFIVHKVLENSDHERTVEAVLATLKEKFGMNKKERFDEIINLIKTTTWKKDEDHDKFLDQMKKIERKWKKEQVDKNGEFFLYRFMMKAGGENIDVYMREQIEKKWRKLEIKLK